jgi:hypothetical protein
VSDSTRSLVLFILVILLLLVLAFAGSSFLMRRALKQVVKMFRDGGALSPETAKFAADLGIRQKGILEIRGLRDYKPSALQFLIRQEVVIVTDDGRVYLSEQKLSATLRI